MENDHVARQIADRIMRHFGAAKVFLYGSRARGDATSDSDYDLVVVAQTAAPPRERAIAVRRALRDLDVPIDVAVYTPDEWEHHRRNPYSFAHYIEQRGVLLHAA